MKQLNNRVVTDGDGMGAGVLYNHYDQGHFALFWVMDHYGFSFGQKAGTINLILNKYYDE